MVKVSVMLVTKRLEPKFLYALQSLKEQTFKDFELIIVDGYYDRRKNEVLSIIDNINVSFPVSYIREKSSRWKGQRHQVCNARNTALIFVNGQYVVHIDDCTKMPNDWIERHLIYLEKGYLVAGSWVGYQFITKDGQGIEGCYGPEYRSTIVKEPNEVDAGWFYGQNCSYPLEPVLDINGFDEILDGEIGQEDISLAIRLQRKGYRVIYDPTNMTEIYTSTHNYEKIIVPVNLKLKDGILHFSNEWITEKLLGDKDRIMPYGNIIDIRTARNIMKECRLGMDDMYKLMERWIDPDLYDWRDGKLIKDKLDMER